MGLCLLHKTRMNTDIDPQSRTQTETRKADLASVHPPERALRRYVSNEMGAQPKKSVVRHLEACEDCRKCIVRLRALARTFRDWERIGIMQAGSVL